jgi:hypothetical protein
MSNLSYAADRTKGGRPYSVAVFEMANFEGERTGFVWRPGTVKSQVILYTFLKPKGVRIQPG